MNVSTISSNTFAFCAAAFRALTSAAAVSGVAGVAAAEEGAAADMTKGGRADAEKGRERGSTGFGK